MKLNTQPYKGARDFYPEDQSRQNYMFGVIRSVVERFGYQEYNAPMIEPLDIYKAKTSDEIVNEQLYSFVDRGGREVAIRPEMTPSVSRMVAAKRQELAYPLRLYSIPNLWRYEKPQRGRMREHWQLNVDIFGDAGLNADAEIILLADQIMKSFGAKTDQYEIRVNSRKLLQKRITSEEVKLKSEVSKVIRALDSYGKVERADLIKKLSELVGNPEKLLDFLENDGPSAEVKQLTELLADSGVEIKPIETLARGFDYYTDIVFEVFDKNPENNRSMFGGGRYDNLVGLFGVDSTPTVGFGMGDVTLANFLESNKLMPKIRPSVDLAVVLIGKVYSQSQNVIRKLREEGLNVSVDFTDRKIDKKLKSIDKQGVRYVMFIGESEIKDERFPLKDLEAGDESKQSIERVIANIKDYRKKEN